MPERSLPSSEAPPLMEALEAVRRPCAQGSEESASPRFLEWPITAARRARDLS